MSLPFDPSATSYFETSLLPPFSQIACILACIKLNLPSILLVEVFLLNKNLILSLFHLKILQLVSNVNKITLYDLAWFLKTFTIAFQVNLPMFCPMKCKFLKRLKIELSTTIQSSNTTPEYLVKVSVSQKDSPIFIEG